jgi:hypothetical protein
MPVTSINSRISIPAVSKLLIAVSFPFPIPFTLIITLFIPNERALSAITVAACPAE